MHVYSPGQSTCCNPILVHEDLLYAELSKLRINPLSLASSVVEGGSSQSYFMSRDDGRAWAKEGGHGTAGST